jgi:hypothetical protein
MDEITNTTGNVGEAQPVEALPVGASKKVILPSGKTAIIYEGYGKDSQRAMEMADGDQSAFVNSLMSLLIEIDGEKMRPDELLALKVKDYLALQGEFSRVNF